jgi:hypothetical protein
MSQETVLAPAVDPLHHPPLRRRSKNPLMRRDGSLGPRTTFGSPKAYEPLAASWEANFGWSSLIVL